MAQNKNITMKQFNGSDYDVLNPSTTASQISGTFDTTQIPNLDASKITSGTFSTTQIPNLAASKITSGTFADARIASASTWNAKQAALVSGTNIKTINNQSILGSGNITVSEYVHPSTK